MTWSVLADALVVLHFAFTAFVIFGGFLTWRWPRLALAHLPALAWGWLLAAVLIAVNVTAYARLIALLRVKDRRGLIP